MKKYITQILTFEQERNIEKYLEKRLTESYFLDFESEISKSDEIGHSHGPGVQKMVGTILSEIHNVEYDTQKHGGRTKRSFSDNVLEGNPNNVKFTVMTEGSPNMVSMKRMLKHVEDDGNQTYYTTTVYFDSQTRKVKVKFVNLLQFTNCLRFNSGPGQIMLNQKQFDTEYTKYMNGSYTVKTFDQIRESLTNLYIEEAQRHIELRMKQLQDFKKKYKR